MGRDDGMTVPETFRAHVNCVWIAVESTTTFAFTTVTHSFMGSILGGTDRDTDFVLEKDVTSDGQDKKQMDMT